MRITLQNTGKRYNREWIFRGVNLDFMPGRKYAITGANGSGKSTLLQTIAGSLMASEGKIIYTDDQQQELPDNRVHQNISLAAPYLELIEEMTTLEMLQFHRSFKNMTANDNDILRTVGLSNATQKQIRYFSSGMKQRMKLALAFFSDTSVILLDEPTTNLDTTGIALYQELISAHTQNRLLIICSNDKMEYACCEAIIKVEDYKK
jgi:ABC-type multidrug transport system ATPase subunit